MTVIIRLPETYRHDHFHLIVTKKSDAATQAIANEVHELHAEGQKLKSAIQNQSPAE